MGDLEVSLPEDPTGTRLPRRRQGHERLIGLDAGQVAYALLFNEDALTSQQPHQTRDDLGE
jgi:hypothetical protein